MAGSELVEHALGSHAIPRYVDLKRKQLGSRIASR